MRTTITLDEETHEFACYYARSKGITLSAAIDELVRRADCFPAAPSEHLELERGPNGLPLLPRTGRTITSEMVKKLAEEEFDPGKFAGFKRTAGAR
jgi:hypothetical protein